MPSAPFHTAYRCLPGFSRIGIKADHPPDCAAAQRKPPEEGPLRYAAGKILDYVEENCHRDTLTLHGAAKELGFSAGYLGDYFKRMTGINFTDHLTRVRLQRACRMLADSNSKTYEIAFSCGFSNAHYFSVVFKKYTGATPTQYRARHRAGGAQTDRTFCNDLELRGKSAHG